MAILFFAFATIGLFGVVCNLASAAGNVICALLKYIILPFVFFVYLRHHKISLVKKMVKCLQYLSLPDLYIFSKQYRDKVEK